MFEELPRLIVNAKVSLLVFATAYWTVGGSWVSVATASMPGASWVRWTTVAVVGMCNENNQSDRPSNECLL